MSDKNPVLPPKAKLQAPSFSFNLSNDSPDTAVVERTGAKASPLVTDGHGICLVYMTISRAN